MKPSPIFTTRRSTIDDAPLFYTVIDKTMRDFIMATWGRWDEARVQRESEKSSLADSKVIQVGGVNAGVFRAIM